LQLVPITGQYKQSIAHCWITHTHTAC